MCFMPASRTSCVLSHSSHQPHPPQHKRAACASATLESSVPQEGQDRTLTETLPIGQNASYQSASG